MAKAFALRVVTPEGAAVEREVTSLVLPGAAGALGVLAGHEPWTVLLKAGRVSFEVPGGSWEHVSIQAGVAQIEPARTIVIADPARGG